MSIHSKTLYQPNPEKTYRVAQWATGTVGAKSLGAVIRHPQLELAGLYVHSESKAGKDAGELCGLDPVGIRATRNIEDIIALQPDCVLYMSLVTDIGEICHLLDAGINVVTTRADFHFPRMMIPEVREQTEAACQQGGASIHSTGASPGFITEAIPLALTSISRRLDCLTIDEFADITSTCSDDIIFQVLGFGRPDDGAISEHLLGDMSQEFGRSLGLVADALGLPFDRVESAGDIATARSRISTPGGGVIEQGTVAAQRLTIAGMRDDKPLLRMRMNWYCTLDLEVDWSLQETGWRVLVEGDTPLDIKIDFPRTSEAYAVQLAGYTAHRAVNSVPYVCAAEPGIRTTMDLPTVVARL